MRILDKTISKTPWAQMTDEQRDRLTSTGDLAPWMFQKSVILTVIDKDGNVQQLSGIEPEMKPTLIERLQTLFTKGKNK